MESHKDLMWYDKHRPKSLDDYVFTDATQKKQIENWIKAPLGNPSLLFGGQTGTGKTTLALLIRDTLIEKGTLEEINAKFISASVDSGIDYIRNELLTFCEVGGFPKLVILDEADRLSKDSQQALRNIIDTYQQSVKFIFTCNAVQNIIDPVKSRTRVVNINQLDKQSFIERMTEISRKEKISLNGESAGKFETIIDSTYPDMRNAINSLQLAKTDDGSLINVNEELAGKNLWREELMKLLTSEAFNVKNARIFVSSVKDYEYARIYKFMCEQSGLFTQEEEAIITIAKYAHRHQNGVSFQDINLLACLLSLKTL